MQRAGEPLREILPNEPAPCLERMQAVVERVVYVESAEDAVAALRARGMDVSTADKLVHEELLAAPSLEAGAVYELYALAAAVAAAVSTALIALH